VLTNQNYLRSTQPFCIRLHCHSQRRHLQQHHRPYRSIRFLRFIHFHQSFCQRSTHIPLRHTHHT
jgi:hypothetical protein